VVALRSDRERDERLTSAMRASATVSYACKMSAVVTAVESAHSLLHIMTARARDVARVPELHSKNVNVDLCARTSSSIYKVITEMKSFSVKCTAQTNQQSLYIMLAQLS
jgi:hypothetical protein